MPQTFDQWRLMNACALEQSAQDIIDRESQRPIIYDLLLIATVYLNALTLMCIVC